MENAPGIPVSGDSDVTSEPDIFSLVDLRLIEAEGGTHYHWNPIEEFYNSCHDGDGRFCSGPGAGLTGNSSLPDKDGAASPVTGPVKRGKRGASLVDPHEGTVEFQGVRGYDKRTGKPVPGTDAWLEAHNIDRKTFNSRPYVKYEADKGDPALADAYKDYPRADKFFKGKAEQEGQHGGYIMIKHEVPGSPYGKIPPQIRPNKEIITNQAIKAQKQAAHDNNLARLEVLKETTGPQLIRERKERLKQAELNVERIKNATPEKVRQEAADNVARAEAGLKKAKESGTPEQVHEAKRELVKIKRQSMKDEKRANNWNAEKEQYDADTQAKWAKIRLEKAQADPKAALTAEIKSQESTIKRSENALKKTAAKYVFPPGTIVSRIDTHPDPQNIKNLTEGKGRIYFAMEGSIKNDAILTAIKREDPTAAVVNVPSVTLWQEKGGAAGELKWFAQTHGKGREIVLIPDADGVYNPNVMQQAKAMSAALKTFGADRVLLAAPPVKGGTKYVIDKFDLPSGKGEERKGIDDHLGAGRGTLGQLQYTTNVKTPSYDLSEFGKADAKTEGRDGKGINTNSIPNTEKALAAISSIVGPVGTSRITKKILAQASGLPQTSAKEARDRLEKKLGIITVEHIFDEQALSRGKRIRNPRVSDERVAELVKSGVIKNPRLDQPFTEVTFDEAPIITIRDSRFLIKHSDVSTGTLSDRPSWKPPPSYKGWTSAVTKKPDSTGIAQRQREAQAKTAARQAANKDRTAQINQDADVKSWLERKTAAPGRRLVRTKEGAERYGVPIGSTIPLAASGGPRALSMVLHDPALGDTVANPPEIGNSDTGLREMDEDVHNENIELYNSCHGEDGRFCQTPGGSDSRTGISGKFDPGSGGKVTTVAARKLGHHVTVDGIKAKAVYEMTGASGQKTRLYDTTGKAGPYKDALLKNHSKLNDQYGPPAHGIIVTKPSGIARHTELSDRRVFATVYSGKRNTYVNSNRLGFDTKTLEPGFQMPSAQTGNTKNMNYILTHEYGHHVDFAKNYRNGVYKEQSLYRSPTFRGAISQYGKTSPIESYAEAFAEWHHTSGTTRNPAAVALARNENWYGSRGVRASGEAENWDPAEVAEWYRPLFETVANNLVHFSVSDQRELLSFAVENESDVEEYLAPPGEVLSFAVEPDTADHETSVEPDTADPDDDEGDLPDPGDGVGVADNFEDGKSTVIGDIEYETPSEDEIAAAEQLMQEVLAELSPEKEGHDGDRYGELSPEKEGHDGNR